MFGRYTTRTSPRRAAKITLRARRWKGRARLPSLETLESRHLLAVIQYWVGQFALGVSNENLIAGLSPPTNTPRRTRPRRHGNTSRSLAIRSGNTTSVA